MDHTLQQRQQILDILKINLQKSQTKMEAQANKKRKACTFQQGDLVLIRLQPYQQSTVQSRLSQKPSKRYFGPYKIIFRIDALAYELALPPKSRIDPVMHVSLLCAFHESHMIPHSASIPQEFEQAFLEKEGSCEKETQDLYLVSK